MKLQFVEIKKRNGKEKKTVLFTWSNLTEKQVPCVAQNFIDGFLFGMSQNGKVLRYPSVMVMDGRSAQSWRWHDSDNGTRWQFENGRGQYITNWDKRKK